MDYEFGMQVDTKSNYIYAFTGFGVKLVKYLKEVNMNELLIIPSEISGYQVTSIKSNCFSIVSENVTTTNKYKFLIPSSITTMESYAIDIQYNNYNVIFRCVDIFYEGDNIPSTWDAYWIYTYDRSHGNYAYWYNENRDEIKVYFNNTWQITDGNITFK